MALPAKIYQLRKFELIRMMFFPKTLCLLVSV